MTRRKHKDPATEAVLSGTWRYTPEQAEANDASRLLSLVASALTACEAAGIAVKLKHGAVMTRVGYVLPLGDGEWAARTLNWTPFGVQAGSDDDDDG
jgi:hypothetical protein